MGLLKDITDVINDLKSDIKGIGTAEYAKRLRGSSIARKGAEGTLQFPVIVSRSLSIDDAIMICKALERQYATFTQITLSLHPYLDLSKDKDISSYLKNFHQNTGNRFSTIGDLLMENSYECLVDNEEEIGAIFLLNEGATPQVIKDNNAQMFSCLDYINENCVNNLYKPTTPTVNFKNNDLNNFFNNRVFESATEMVMEAKNRNKKSKQKKWKPGQPIPDWLRADSDNNSNTIGGNDQQNNPIDPVEPDFNRYSSGPEPTFDIPEPERVIDYDPAKGISDPINADVDEHEARRRIQDLQRSNQDKYHRGRDNINDLRYKAEWDRNQQRFNAQNMGNAQVRMTDNDCKKANELVPTTLAVALNVKDNGNFGGTVNFLIGIKTILHPVSSDEMVRNIVIGCRNSNKFFNFIRWTTGELTFIKDFLLNIDGIKEDVINRMTTKESGWWAVLRNRKRAARAKRIIPTGKEILPNASIVMSLDEVEMIKAEYGFDLTDPNMVIKLMREYFLLSFVVVDPSQELVTFMFDGQDKPQTMSYAGLERENSNKNDFKEIYKMINSGRI